MYVRIRAIAALVYFFPERTVTRARRVTAFGHRCVIFVAVDFAAVLSIIATAGRQNCMYIHMYIS